MEPVPPDVTSFEHGGSGRALQIASRSFTQRAFGPLSGGSQRASVLALAATAFGSGILALPWVFSILGIGLGLAMLLFSGGVSLLSQRLLANAAYATGLSSYASITKKTLGGAASLALDVIIFIFAFGSCCGYFVFIGQFAPQLCEALGLPDWLGTHDDGRRNIIMILACFPLTPIVMLRSLAGLRYATLGSIISLFIVAIMIVGVMPSLREDLVKHEVQPLPTSWWMEPHIPSWEKFPAAMAINFYSFCCHVNLFAKYRELDAPTSYRVDKVLVRSVVLEVIVYAFVGVCGFLALGEPCVEAVPTAEWPSCTPVNILASPRFSGVVGVVIRIFMILTLTVCIPLYVAAGREILEQRIIAWKTGEEYPAPEPQAASPTNSPPSSPQSDPNSPPQCVERPPPPQLPLVGHLVLSIGFLYVAALVAIVYPKLNTILSILGGFCAVTFMFTIPIAASLILYFGHHETLDGLRRGMIGRRRAPGTQQIGSFLGVTKRGTIVAALVTSICVVLGYLSAALALVDMLTGAS